MNPIRHLYRKHATTIDCIACIVIPILCVIAIILCIIYGATIDNFLPNKF